MNTSTSQIRGEASTYPYARSKAAAALSKALQDRSDNDGLSLRTIAGRLGYKSAVVVSHMRTGRLPIPVDRAIDIAAAVGLDPGDFLGLVLEQRYPEIDLSLRRSSGAGTEARGVSHSQALLDELFNLSGKTLDEMSTEHLGVIREVVADLHPRRRWLTIAEANMISALRAARPHLMQDGLTPNQLASLRDWATKLT